MAKSNAKLKNYTAQDIEVLEGLEPVRKRPGMFIAGTDTPAGLHQLIWEILDNSVDEAMNGYASKIDVVLHADYESVTVTDNGRGIPVEKHPKFKKPALELILTTLHAGGKFSDKNYQTSGGLHGVGSSVVNALSEELVATVRRDGKEYEQRFSRGLASSSLKVKSKAAKGTGTTIFFRPDSTIFKHKQFAPELVRETIQTKAYLNPGIELTFHDERTCERQAFLYQDGLRAYLKQLLEDRKVKLIGDEPFFIEKSDDFSVIMAVAWTESPKEEWLSYANGIYTADGGSHELGAKSGLVKAIRNYMSVHDIQAKGVKITADDIREGVICLTSVLIPSSKTQAQFQGQTKGRLNNPEVFPVVESAARALEQRLNQTPSTAQAIVNRIVLAAKAREASRSAGQSVRRKLGISHRLTLPGKLADCSSNSPQKTELFIVEGDSAGGSTKQGRDRHFQAVLPLRGKVLNTIAAPNKKISENRELSNIIAALGCGAGEAFRADKLRYGKVIILTDADADGMHIATLLLGFFFTHLRGLIQQGALFIGKPPLYGIFPKGRRAKGSKGEGKAKVSKQASLFDTDNKSVYWAYSEEELAQILKRNKLEAPRIVRYKGLGEMNPSTLWETTLDPATRTLLRVKVVDEAEVFRALQALMGPDSSTRFEMIQQNASRLELDV